MPDTSIKGRLQELGIYDESLSAHERYDLPKLVEHLQIEGAGAGEASILVSLYAEYLDARVLKCAVYASNGDVRKLDENFDLAMRDWHNVIMMGEYEHIGNKLVRIRNFS